MTELPPPLERTQSLGSPPDGSGPWHKEFFASADKLTSPTIQMAALSSDRGPSSPISGTLDMPPLNYGGLDRSLARPHHNDVAADHSRLKPDAFQTNAGKFDPDKLVDFARGAQGRDLTIPPRGLGIGDVPKKYGCAAALSNIGQKTGLFGPGEFSASVDGVEALLKSKGAKRVDLNHLQDGDIIVGRGEKDGSGGRHIGIADVGAGGKVSVYNNHVGVWTRDTLKDRFLDRYSTVYALRLP
ncbi:MAG: hypothetical protein JSS83_27760 [Cyanobacteria bacterium SZAS LIN-3]|nr:hypothetical protein [Cyanobacteria bacterium SZAS LIN-3]